MGRSNGSKVPLRNHGEVHAAKCVCKYLHYWKTYCTLLTALGGPGISVGPEEGKRGSISVRQSVLREVSTPEYQVDD